MILNEYWLLINDKSSPGRRDLREGKRPPVNLATDDVEGIFPSGESARIFATRMGLEEFSICPIGEEERAQILALNS